MPQSRPQPRRPPVNQHSALKHLQLGRQLQRGEGTIEVLAPQYGLRGDKNTEYKARRLARRFSDDPDELARLCSLERNGRRVGWSHVIEIMRVEGAARRRELVELTLNQRLNAATLRQVIRGYGRSPSLRAGSGRKRRPPRNSTEAVWRAKRDLEGLRFTLVWLRDNAEPSSPPDRQTALTRSLHQLREIEISLRSLGQSAHKIIENYAAALPLGADEIR